VLENGYRRIGSRKDHAAWTPIREALRQAMQADKLTAMSLGRRLGLSESAIDKCSAPNGPRK
jgi:hypothetical protein